MKRTHTSCFITATLRSLFMVLLTTTRFPCNKNHTFWMCLYGNYTLHEPEGKKRRCSLLSCFIFILWGISEGKEWHMSSAQWFFFPAASQDNGSLLHRQLKRLCLRRIGRPTGVRPRPARGWSSSFTFLQECGSYRSGWADQTRAALSTGGSVEAVVRKG